MEVNKKVNEDTQKLIRHSSGKNSAKKIGILTFQI